MTDIPAAPVRAGLVPLAWRRMLLRHVVVIGLSAALIYGFAVVHGQWSPMHRWNRAFADASLALLVITMSMGPAARLWPVLLRAVAYRRETGIYATLLAAVHTVIILGGWVEWDFARLFGYEIIPQTGEYVMFQQGFGLANLIGIAALAYALILMFTSNDRSIRLLGTSVWKFLQNGATVLWGLALAHTAYFLFMHFLSFHRPTPEPNPLQWPFVAAILSVLLLRAAAFVSTWGKKRNSSR
ncbi:ferric reductase-like transmembrane domain-containing protein [Aminobacter sp. BE322]|uniref:ferric reductase-like transmembrane domain-containing protein n=1 Tax=unclassified Aminobacter TaxID=2644704 RepID=UPI003D1E3550